MYALSLGVDLGSFWALTPHTLGLIAKGYEIAAKRQIARDNVMAHLQGLYFCEALYATVGNMLSSKNSRKYDYPEKPYELDLDEEQKQSKEERQIELFAAQLTARMNNFNLSKEQG